MIPKIIHYCWFGRNPLPSLAVNCINSWKKYLPDYEIIEWNEDNFPVDKYLFAQEALESKKYAFVSDVCRLYALYEYGGIYMDTDVEVVKTYNPLLNLIAFSGFENDDFVPTGTMASIKESEWISDLLSYYDNRHFIKDDGTFDVLSNTHIITNMMLDKGFIMNNKFQEIENYVTFFPNDYFCPKSYKTGKIEATSNTYCIHHFAKSWIPANKRYRNIIKMNLKNIFGHNNIQKLIDLFSKK